MNILRTKIVFRSNKKFLIAFGEKIKNNEHKLKYLTSVIYLIFLPKTLIWNKNHVLAKKFTESCRAGGKWAYKEYLQKYLPVFFFLSYLSLLIVKISGAYN